MDDRNPAEMSRFWSALFHQQYFRGIHLGQRVAASMKNDYLRETVMDRIVGLLPKTGNLSYKKKYFAYLRLNQQICDLAITG